MRLTDAAALRIKDVMARADRPVAGVRVGVKNGGCAGMEYTMEYADAVKPSDEVVEDKGVKILVDPKAVLFCSAPRWTTRPTSCRRSSSSTIRTRPAPAAAANPCSSRRPRARRNNFYATCIAVPPAVTSGSVSHITRLRPWRLAA